jgi:flagellar hook-associated protein 3 FlgL
MRVDPNYVSTLADSLNKTQATEQSLASQLSSGVRITSLSDDPVAAGQNVSLMNQIQQDDTFTSNATMVKGQLQVADSALGSVVTELTSAISLATSANNGSLSTDEVKSIATQLTGVLSEVQTLANTSYQGQYIFAGSATSTSPFSTSGGVTTYSGDSDVNYLELPNGEQIQLNVPGDQIFTSSTASVFGSLNALISDYSTGTVNVTQATTDLTTLNSALNYVSRQRVVIDNSINQVSSAADATSNLQTQLTTAQTNLLQADVATLSTKLSTSESQFTALESVIVSMESSSNSLFERM